MEAFQYTKGKSNWVHRLETAGKCAPKAPFLQMYKVEAFRIHRNTLDNQRKWKNQLKIQNN